MDNFLYIIIGVIWVAFSLYNNKQKQDRKRAASQAQGNTPPQAVPPPKRSFLEEILMGELRPEQFPVEVEEEEEYKPEVKPKHILKDTDKYKTEAQSLEVITEEVPENYFEHQYATRKDEKGNISEMKTEALAEGGIEESDLRIAGEFDLRTAVIYAEILNPRYF